MHLVFFCHPPFMRSQSMPRFARMIGEAMTARGHHVEYWSPSDTCHRRFAGTRLAKWAGYIDQYLLFPMTVKRRIAAQAGPTLYVFCDQALGPWVPLAAHRPHVVHAHDLLALRSALGLIPANPTSATGRLYQRYIRRGFRHARHFISVSERTRRELEQHGGVRPATSHVVYNGVHPVYSPMPCGQAIEVLARAGLGSLLVDERGFLLHVGGGQWYKNTAGVLRLYARYVQGLTAPSGTPHAKPAPLLMVSPPPATAEVAAALAAVPPQGRVVFRQGLDNEALRAAYSLAEALLFPSLAEGFGWPIVEAQACGCPVITTDDAPMNEIGGPLAHYLPLPSASLDIEAWTADGAALIARVLDAADAHDPARRAQRIAWAARFSRDKAIEAYEALYARIMAEEAWGATGQRDPLHIGLPTGGLTAVDQAEAHAAVSAPRSPR